jgi:Protein of unknown function (DUF1214)
MKYMLKAALDSTDTFVQALGGIGLGVANGFDWQALDEPRRAGLERAVPVVDEIIDERWATIGETVNGWRFALATGRCSYDFALNAANVKNQVGTDMYDDEMFFVANEADRFTIGSTTDGVTGNSDGSLTIYVQHARPDDQQAANWLPALASSFNLTMRYYAPLAPVLDKTDKLPAPQTRG